MSTDPPNRAGEVAVGEVVGESSLGEEMGLGHQGDGRMRGSADDMGGWLFGGEGRRLEGRRCSGDAREGGAGESGGVHAGGDG
jgi:hypothetical protein